MTKEFHSWSTRRFYVRWHFLWQRPFRRVGVHGEYWLTTWPIEWHLVIRRQRD